MSQAVLAEQSHRIIPFKAGRESEIACPFLAGSESESWETTFRKLVNEKKVNEPKALWVKIGIVFGDSAISVSDHHNAAFGSVPAAFVDYFRLKYCLYKNTSISSSL